MMPARKIKIYITAQAEPKWTTWNTSKKLGDKKFISQILKDKKENVFTKTSLAITSG